MRNLFALFALLAADTVVRAAEFPAPYNSEKDTQSSAMSPTDAAKGFSVPPGFKVSVFAAEPEVQNPIAMSWDPRGRLWIAENYTYAERPTKFDMGLYDRVVMFEDTDHDGRADQRTVFTDRVQMLTGLEVGHGGVWLMCPPQVLFIADRDGDDKPDGEPEVVLDGFTLSPENYHNFANGLRFGPDGWLYGRCGASCPGEVGVPGTDDKHRWPVRGGIWRYHPTRKTFETICHGTTNPWGMDWNERGELFFVNTVNGHLWHSIPGAHFDRPHTQDPNPRCYAQMQMHADHWHWDTGEKWSDSRGATGEHGRLGGGHAHSGTSIYLGQNWPREYFGKLLTLNLHGRRVNVESLQRAGSGYVGKHDPDMLQAADPWFRGIELGYGPDGGVYILDWSDTGECHEQTGVHRTSGRIFKVTYGQPVRPKVRDLGKLDSETLVSLAVGDRGAEWFVRQVRLVLAERAAQGERIQRKLPGVFYTSPEAALDDLRKLWAAYSIGEIDHPRLVSLLRNPDESIRTWAIRLLSDDWPIDSILGPMPDVATKVDPALLDKFAGMAASDGSGLVRLALASTIQRLPVELRTKLAAPLVARSEDANDQNLPLLVWYGLIPVADANPDSLVTLVEKSQWPLIRRFVARRLAEEIDERPAPVDALVQLAVQKDFSEAAVCDVVAGMVEGLAGRRKARPPEKWSSL
ncbi:MAG TPA: PVC-type heme-binding CxxCH protein, partial [Pirellulales bacterium]|nr:PVC-type heme-binding CxxCH protein [Pirellulales bacterium]